MSLSMAWLASVCAATMAGAAGVAQTQDNATSASAGSEEVVVTAQKRSEKLMNVPVAVSAYTAERRQIVGIDNLQDYTRFTPGLSYSGSTDRVFIRGIGRQTNTNGSDPGVATYTDGIYDSSTARVSVSDFFLDRVEILRGPQGTLYGRNSIGGAIDAISKRPTDVIDGEVRATIGNYGTTNFEGSVSGPLTSWLRARLAGAYYNQDKGYFRNVAGGPSEGGVNEQRYLELQLDADLASNVHAWLKAYVGSSDGRPRSEAVIDPYDYSPYPPGNIAPGSAFGILTGDYTALGGISQNPTLSDIRNFAADTTQTTHLHDNHGVTGELTWDLEGATIKYLGGYQEYKYAATSEIDNTAITSYVFPLTAFSTCSFVPGCTPLTVEPSQQFNYIENKRYWSQELDISSTGDGPVQWIGGLYYYSEQAHQESHFNAPDQAQLKAPVNGPTNPSGDFVTAESSINTESYAAFGQVDWKVTDSIQLTGGLRYTHDHKDGVEDLRIVCLGCAAGLTPDVLGSLTPGLDITSASVSHTPTAGVTSDVVIDPVTGIASRTLASSWDAVTGTAGLEWRPDDKTLAYARYSRGYKSGGFNAGGITADPETDAEHVNAYELGFKRRFDSRLDVNASAFYYDYAGLQVPLTVTTLSGANMTEFFNLDSSRSYGLELEATWRPIDNLALLLSYGYADSKIEEACCFVDGQDPNALQPGAKPIGALVAGQQPQSLVGQQLPETPRNKVALAATYSLNFDPGTLDLTASYTWQDSSYALVFNREYNKFPSFEQVDLRAVWTDSQDRFRVIGFVKNVFDDTGYDGARGLLYGDIGAALTGLEDQRILSLTPPRTYGVQFQYHFR